MSILPRVRPSVQPARRLAALALASLPEPMPTLAFAIGIARPSRPDRVRSPRGGCIVAGRFYRGGSFLPAMADAAPAPATNPRDSQPDRADERWAVAGPSPVASPTPTPPPALATTRFAIHGFDYTAREVPAGECGSVAFELHRPDTNHTYHVLRDGFGEVTCSCPDFELRRAGTGMPCKHGAKLIELGLIEAPTPRLLPLGPRRDQVDGMLTRPARTRRFEPSPEEMAEAAQLLADSAGAC